MECCAAWEHLPAELLLHIVRIASCGTSDGLAAATITNRLVCKGWRHSLPLGHCVPAKLYAWDAERIMASLAPHARRIEVLAPLRGAQSSPLPQLERHCGRLRCLTLRHIHAGALPAVGRLTALEMLDATVLYPAADPCWLDFAASLGCLKGLRLKAAQLRLQPEEGLACLLPLSGSLAALRLDGCLLLTDAGAALLAQLGGLERLEVTCCQLGQAGVDALAAALPRLAHIELRLPDGVAGDRLLAQTAIGDAGSLAAHLSRHKAHDLVAAAGQRVPRLARLAVHLQGTGFLLTAAPTFHLLRLLTCLRLPRVQLTADAVHQLAACTRLEELEVEFNFTVRDEAILAWRSLTQLRRLRLGANFYLSEAALAGALAAMPRLRHLRLEHVQGDGGAVLAPLAGMPGMSCLELACCHLTGGPGLEVALRGATGLAHLRVQSCGIQSEVVDAVAAALQGLPALRGLGLAMRRAPALSTVEALVSGCAGCTQLTNLDIHFGMHRGSAPAVPVWRQLSALSGLRRLHISSGMGWEGQAFAEVAAAATALRSLTVTDNAGTVDEGWMAWLAQLSQLSQLQLNCCRGLGPECAGPLCQLSALTSMEAFRCPALSTAAVMQQLRGGLPCLAHLSMHE